MAANLERTPSSHIACPLCLEVFKDATLLTCGHTFCQSCLDMYDKSHHDLDHMVCPLCRKSTVLDEKRVAGLPLNITVNGMVEEYLTHGNIGPTDKGKSGPADKGKPKCKCTACEQEDEAVSFCTSCGHYMCGKCHHGHQQFLTSLFKGHCVITLKDIIEKGLTIDQFSDKCPEHERDDRDLFCVDCKVYVCFKCKIVDHRDHKIINRPEFEDELQKEVTVLLQRSSVKLQELKNNALDTEAQRPGVHEAFQKQRNEVERAFNTKVEKLQKNGTKMIEEIKEFKNSFHSEIDVLKASDKEMITRISSYVSLLKNAKLGHLERDSLITHSLICEELDVLLDTPKYISGADILETAQDKRLLLADPEVFDLGVFSEWKIVSQLDLPHGILGMARKDTTGVVITQSRNVSEVHSDGKRQDMEIPKHADGRTDFCYSDITLLGDDKLLLYSIRRKYYMFSMRDFLVTDINVPLTQYGTFIRLDTSCLGEILIANEDTQFRIWDPSSQKITHTINTTHVTKQAFATKSGLVVTSSCDRTNHNGRSPRTVRVYDRDGKGGHPLTSSEGEYLYPVVDFNDRVFVANINKESGNVQIILYDLQGLNLKERLRCRAQKLTLNSTWCYLVSLPHNVLALACDKKLYFIKYPHF